MLYTYTKPSYFPLFIKSIKGHKKLKKFDKKAPIYRQRKGFLLSSAAKLPCPSDGGDSAPGDAGDTGAGIPGLLQHHPYRNPLLPGLRGKPGLPVLQQPAGAEDPGGLRL